MKTLWVTFFAAFSAATFVSAAEAPAKTHTSRSMLASSSKAADRKAKQDLLSILQPAGKFVKGMHARVVMKTMRTRPYGAGLQGLCRMDELSLHYIATANRREPIDDPLQPIGLEAKPLFHAAEGPIPGYDDVGFGSEVRSPVCTKLESDKSARWFVAPDAFEAARGVNILLATVAALQTGMLKVKECSLETEAGVACEQEVLKIARIDKVSRIAKDCEAGPSQECYTVFLDETVYLMVRASFYDERAVAPTTIDSLSVGQYIVVT